VDENGPKKEERMPVLSVIQAIHDAMFEEMNRDKRVFVFGEDVGKRGGVFLATEGLLEEFGERRVIDTPVSESAIVGIAIGAALYGLRPIAEIEFVDFIWPAVNQIIGEAARLSYGTNGSMHCPMVVRAPYGGGVRGGLYHSQSVETHFAHTPGLKVIIPSTPFDAKGLLKSAIRDGDPVIFLEHKRSYRSVWGDVPEQEYTIPIGEAEVKREGKDITCVTYGLMVHYCLEAAELVSKRGVEVEVLDLRTLRPLDKDCILASVRKTSRLMIVYEDNKTLGIGSEVAAAAAEEAFEYLDAPVLRLAGPEVPAMPFSPSLEALFIPTVENLVTALMKLANY